MQNNNNHDINSLDNIISPPNKINLNSTSALILMDTQKNNLLNNQTLLFSVTIGKFSSMFNSFQTINSNKKTNP